MKVVILAGGLGSRLEEITKVIPKPMILIQKKPIILYVMRTFIKFGHCDFVIALGYKGEKILEYFSKKKITTSIKSELKKGLKVELKLFGKNCSIIFLDTGLKTMTGGRLKRASKLIQDDKFFATYGDGLGDINISKLKSFHKKKNKMVTVTAVNPPARFGEIIMKNNQVIDFTEKQPIKSSWINGGYFIITKKFINYIKNDQSILEREPLETIAKKNQLSAYKHHSLWQCLDTKRDIPFIKNLLPKIFK